MDERDVNCCWVFPSKSMLSSLLVKSPRLIKYIRFAWKSMVIPTGTLKYELPRLTKVFRFSPAKEALSILLWNPPFDQNMYLQYQWWRKTWNVSGHGRTSEKNSCGLKVRTRQNQEYASGATRGSVTVKHYFTFWGWGWRTYVELARRSKTRCQGMKSKLKIDLCTASESHEFLHQS